VRTRELGLRADPDAVGPQIGHDGEVRTLSGLRLAWTSAVLSAVLGVAGLWIAVLDASRTGPASLDQLTVSIGMALTLPVLGAFIVTRDRQNGLGWAFVAAGISRSAYVLATVWVQHTYVLRPGSWSGGSFATWVATTFQLPAIILAPLILLLAPNGRLNGRGWRWAYAPVVLAGLAWLVAAALVWPYRGMRLLPGAATPNELTAHVAEALTGVAILGSLIGLVAGLVSLVARLRGPDRNVAQQMKWYLFGATAAVVLNLVGDLVVGNPSFWNVSGLLAFEVAAAIAVQKHGLWDIDRLINRTLVYGILSGLAAAVYGLTVVSLGVLLAGVAHRQQVAVAGATLAAIALMTPARGSVQRLIDRRFDRRAYDAVAQVQEFTSRQGSEPTTPEELKFLLSTVLRDPDLDVAFRVGGGAVVDTGAAATVLPATTAQLMITPPTILGEGHSYVVHRRPNDSERHLFNKVLGAAANSLEHAHLQAELGVQLAAVEASRTRIVTAADDERRRVERDLHDGAQQRLVALAMQLRSEQRRLGADLDPEVDSVFDAAVTQLQAAVEDLRALAQGLVPASLASEGLGPALGELVSRHSGAVRLVRIPDHRHQLTTEATAWFVACEGLTNAAKHAPAAEVTVDATCSTAELTVSITDAGPGGAALDAGSGLRGLCDRVLAIGGTLTIDSIPGQGTTLRAVLPCG
jgi:signal transduction histidine kinase